MRNEWRREVASAQAQGILNLSQQGFGPKPGITNVGRERGKEGGRRGKGRLSLGFMEVTAAASSRE